MPAGHDGEGGACLPSRARGRPCGSTRKRVMPPSTNPPSAEPTPLPSPCPAGTPPPSPPGEGTETRDPPHPHQPPHLNLSTMSPNTRPPSPRSSHLQEAWRRGSHSSPTFTGESRRASHSSPTFRGESRRAHRARRGGGSCLPRTALCKHEPRPPPGGSPVVPAGHDGEGGPASPERRARRGSRHPLRLGPAGRATSPEGEEEKGERRVSLLW